MLYDEFLKLSFEERKKILREIDTSTPEGRKNADDVINYYDSDAVNTLLLNVRTLTEDDLVSIFKRFSGTKSCYIRGQSFAGHPNFTLNVLNQIKSKRSFLGNSVLVAAAKTTKNEEIYNILYSLGKKSILNACKNNPHFDFRENEELSENIKLILFMVNSGEISENTGLEILNKFNVPAAVIIAMFKQNSKWRKFILEHNKLKFESIDEQFMIANDFETDEKILYELSRVVENNDVKKAILAHPNCTLEIARNMFK
jgi:hypothetical protein